MGQLAERVPVVQRKPQPVERRPIAEAQPPRSTAHANGFAEARVKSPVSEIVGGLPARLRAGVESLSGIAMDDVRVHRNSSEPAKLGARAFTRGSEIYLGPRQEQHLPHEAWHVVQQKQGRVHAKTQMKGAAVNDDVSLEREADRMGDAARSDRGPQRSNDSMLPRAVSIPQSRTSIQFAPVGPPPSLTLPEALEIIAQRIAKLAVGPASSKVNLKGGPDKVVSVVRNMRTGQIYVGLNTGEPAVVADVIREATNAQKARIAAGEVKVVHTAADAVGGHAEVNALNKAILEEERALGVSMTEEALAKRFEVHNVWLSGKNKLQTAPRCEHCSRITRGVSVTESLFIAEGGVAGEIIVPQASKPPIKPPTSAPQSVPEAAPKTNVPLGPSAARTPIRPVVIRISANVVLFVATYFIMKWYGEKQAAQFNSDLKKLLPDMNAKIQGMESEILEKQKQFPFVYGNITVGFTHDRNDPDDYMEGSMTITDVTVSHQNYQTADKILNKYDWLQDIKHVMTFSVPLFEEVAAEKGALPHLLPNYRELRKILSDPGDKARLSAVINLGRLALSNVSLTTPVVRDLLGALKDTDPLVRLTAAYCLRRLKARIAIPYIREVLSITTDANHKKLIEAFLNDIERG